MKIGKTIIIKTIMTCYNRNRFIKKIINKYFSFIQNRTLAKYKRKFILNDTISYKEKVYNFSLSNSWQKKDEYSTDITNIELQEWYGRFFISPPSYQESFLSNNRIIKTDSFLKLLSDERKENRWIMFQKRELQEDYAVEFDIKINSVFSELQFAFHMEHLLKRFRFLISNNNKLNFEVVDNGFFLPAIHSIPLKLTLGERYRIRIEIQNNIFCFFLNNKIKLAIQSPLPQKKAKTSMALILYEKSRERIIDAEIYNYNDN